MTSTMGAMTKQMYLQDQDANKKKISELEF